jgi:plasmid stabilization system protein ParE
MAHRLSAEVESDLDNIWVYVARQSGSLETADRLIDSLTERIWLLVALPSPGPPPRPRLTPRLADISARRLRDRLSRRG